MESYFDPANWAAGLIELEPELASLSGVLGFADLQLMRDLLLWGEAGGSSGLCFLLFALALSQSEGSLALGLDKDNLVGLFTRAGLSAELATKGARLIGPLIEGEPGGLLSFVDETPGVTPIVISREEGLAWWQRFYLAERRLEAAFGARSSLEALGAGRAEALERGLAFEEFRLNPEQVRAVESALEVKTLIISGGPGTGKTTTVAAILRALFWVGLDQAEGVALAAPTGRAAQRVKDSLSAQVALMTGLTAAEAGFFASLESRTIHRLLESGRSGQDFRYSQAYPLNAELIVIDEVSMVDIELMNSLLAAVKPSARLILIGDRDQLPSVEAGAVLAEILPETGTRLGPGLAAVILEENRRSVKEINQLAQLCNAGQAEDFLALIPPDSLEQLAPAVRRPLARIEPPPEVSFAWWKGFVFDWLDLVFGAAEEGPGFIELVAGSRPDTATRAAQTLLELLDRARILALTREGRYGVSGLNSIAISWLKTRLETRGFDPERLKTLDERGGFHGLPIMITRNDHARRLYNGDVGIILGREAWFKAGEGGEMRSFELGELGAYQPAFALTVHKSQGSEYGRVLLVFPEERSLKILKRQIVYTGITRAKESVLLYGSARVIQTAIKSRIERASGLSLYD